MRSARATGSDSIGSAPGASLQAIPESTSEEGTGSRLPWLPSESQANSAGGAPSDSIASSIIRRISASPTIEITLLMWAVARSARWSVMTVERSLPAASRSSSFVFASAMAPRRTNGVCASAATRSMPTITPSTSDRDERTGTWRTLLSSIASITSAPVCSAPTVTIGAVITSLTGASTGTPPTITRERKSRSVTIPSTPSRCGRAPRSRLFKPCARPPPAARFQARRSPAADESAPAPAAPSLLRRRCCSRRRRLACGA